MNSKEEFAFKNDKNTDVRRKEQEKKSNFNESQRFRQLSSHNDSFEYTVMNLNRRSNTRNWRLFLIRHVILPQRSKRIYVNTIHSIYSSDFRGFCTTNILNCLVTFIVMFLLMHSIWIILATYLAFDQKTNTLDMTSTHWRNFNVLILLVIAMYPLVLSILAVVMLIQNLLCTQEYENMFVWHRDSVIRYLQYLIGYSCIASF